MMRKLLLTILLFFSIFTFPEDVFALDQLSHPVSGVSAFTFNADYQGDCARTNPKEQDKHLLIVPNNNADIDSVYLYFHGLSATPVNTAPPRMCHGYLNLCDTVKTLSDNGKNVAIIAARIDKGKKTDTFREFNSREMKCFTDKARQKLSSLGRGIGTDLTLVGHSAGGRSVMYALNQGANFAGMSPSRTIIFDACYGDWCDNIVKSNKYGTLYFYADPAINSGGTLHKIKRAIGLASNQSDIRLVNLYNKSHSDIPKLCLADHVTRDACKGKGEVLQEGTIAAATAAPIAPTEGVLNTAQEQNIEKSIETLIMGSKQQVKTPGFHIAGSHKASVNTDGLPGLGSLFSLEDSIDVEEVEGGKVDLRISLLGNYIVWAFQYSLMAIGIIAILMIIFSGFQWMTSAGNASVIKKAQSRIGQSIMGVTLASLSYVILFAINPDLTRVGDFNIRIATSNYDPPENEMIDEATAYSGGYVTKSNITPPTWNHKTFDCSKKGSYKETGVAPKASVTTYRCDGIRGNITTLPEAKPAVCNAGKIAKKKGYELEVRSSYRPFSIQVDLWCGRGKKQYADTATRKKYYATPGFSKHGHGRALDIKLLKNGKALNTLSSKGQCKTGADVVKALAEIFYEADANFVRLETEIWHFEYGTKGTSSRDRYNTHPYKCTNKPAGISSTKGPNTPNLAPPPAGANLASGVPSAAPAPGSSGVQSPAARANKCTFTENRWHTGNGRSELVRRETDFPYDRLKAEGKGYISKVDPRCSICEQDLVTINLNEIGLGGVRVRGGSLKMCWAYADQVKNALKAIKDSNQFQIEELVGYRPLRSAGALDEKGRRSGVSGHLYGMAIDLNPAHNGLYNGCQNFDPVANPRTPNNGCTKSIGGVWDPSTKPTKSIAHGSIVHQVFTRNGWQWGGTDMPGGRQKDFMDFSRYGYDFSL